MEITTNWFEVIGLTISASALVGLFTGLACTAYYKRKNKQ